ncbi:MAG: 50S ribosomal protein L18 [bacterium]|nr:50S ribosomal protein L18 [bacterium]MDZ4247861.1 50S ribosomal protein L18 [Patescibacteria group bacterium]
MKTVARQARHRRVRSRVNGTAERPRLAVFRGSKSLSAQLIDDAAGTVLLTVGSSKKLSGADVAAGEALGTELAKQAKAKKVATAVFDRAGYRYHGVVKAVCEAARKGGLKV